MKIKPPRQAQEWSYSSHRESIGKALTSLGFRSNKEHISIVAHQLVWRVTCVRTRIKYDARADGRTQRWRAYLTSLPRKIMRSMAGFITNGRSFYLARAVFNPPTSLCEKLFPAIDERHDRLAAKELILDDPIQPTVAANAFVQVITMLRETFIQDSVLMMELHPCHPIWQHSVFSDPAYLPFKRKVHIIA
ncbi:hypothetical protein [Absidia glauca]|uniref:Ndc10 domain-containing protein n=1 Tax=Absidia glauca TaxID=4829 RepID=A0A163IRP2_ABSGL|nr:hypothetical protein [Absidia glauca]